MGLILNNVLRLVIGSLPTKCSYSHPDHFCWHVSGVKLWLQSLLLPFSCYPNHLPGNPMFSSVQSGEHFLGACPLLASRETNDSVSDLEAVIIRNGRGSSGYKPGADRHTSGMWYTENTFVPFMASPWRLNSILLFVKSAKLPHLSLFSPAFEAALSSRISGLDLLS